MATHKVKPKLYVWYGRWVVDGIVDCDDFIAALVHAVKLNAKEKRYVTRYRPDH